MGFELTTDCTGSCKSNYHTIITTTTNYILVYILKKTTHAAFNAITCLFNIWLFLAVKCRLCGVIIPKSSTSEAREPMSYRGLIQTKISNAVHNNPHQVRSKSIDWKVTYYFTLVPVAYKRYCGVLSTQLTVKWDDMEVINDE